MHGIRGLVLQKFVDLLECRWWMVSVVFHINLLIHVCDSFVFASMYFFILGRFHLIYFERLQFKMWGVDCEVSDCWHVLVVYVPLDLLIVVSACMCSMIQNI